MAAQQFLPIVFARGFGSASQAAVREHLEQGKISVVDMEIDDDDSWIVEYPSYSHAWQAMRILQNCAFRSAPVRVEAAGITAADRPQGRRLLGAARAMRVRTGAARAGERLEELEEDGGLEELDDGYDEQLQRERLAAHRSREHAHRYAQLRSKDSGSGWECALCGFYNQARFNNEVCYNCKADPPPPGSAPAARPAPAPSAAAAEAGDPAAAEVRRLVAASRLSHRAKPFIPPALRDAGGPAAAPDPAAAPRAPAAAAAAPAPAALPPAPCAAPTGAAASPPRGCCGAAAAAGPGGSRRFGRGCPSDWQPSVPPAPAPARPASGGARLGRGAPPGLEPFPPPQPNPAGGGRGRGAPLGAEHAALSPPDPAFRGAGRGWDPSATPRPDALPPPGPGDGKGWWKGKGKGFEKGTGKGPWYTADWGAKGAKGKGAKDGAWAEPEGDGGAGSEHDSQAQGEEASRGQHAGGPAGPADPYDDWAVKEREAAELSLLVASAKGH